MLKKDHRYESVEMLDKSVREKMFDDHVSVLKKKKKDKFKQMLSECADITLNLPFKDVSCRCSFDVAMWRHRALKSATIPRNCDCVTQQT